jgi:hypothetical protein
MFDLKNRHIKTITLAQPICSIAFINYPDSDNNTNTNNNTNILTLSSLNRISNSNISHDIKSKAPTPITTTALRDDLYTEGNLLVTQKKYVLSIDVDRWR